MIFRTLFVAVFFIALFSSCESISKKYGSNGLAVTGKVGEILVVCDKSIWDSEIHNYLDSNLTQFIMPYYPDVATFELIHRTPSKFTDAIKRYRNTLILKIDGNYNGKQAKIEKKYHVWATDQLLIEITAKDYNQLVEVCKNGMAEVHGAFDFYEWKRIMHNLNKNNSPIYNSIESNFGIKLKLPEGSKSVWKRDNFYRIEFPAGSKPIEFVGTGTQDPGTIFSGIMIYQYDYTDSSQFNLKQLLNDRDTMLRYNVPHQVENMHMGTQYMKEVFPIMENSQNATGNIKGYEIRGMFQFKHKTLNGTGGAFWAFHFLHPKRKKIICISGYVDAPSTTSWTHSLREVQAVWKSVELIN
jgi:hypothetical protein